MPPNPPPPVSVQSGDLTPFYTLPAQTNTAQIQQNTGAIDTNTTNIATNTRDIASLRSELSNTNEKVDENTEGVALALAMVGGLTLPDGNTYAISGNWGTFEGENALAFGAIARVSKNVYVTGGFGAGLNNGTFGGRAGISFSR
jgi:hypothetical protein